MINAYDDTTPDKPDVSLASPCSSSISMSLWIMRMGTTCILRNPIVRLSHLVEHAMQYCDHIASTWSQHYTYVASAGTFRREARLSRARVRASKAPILLWAPGLMGPADSIFRRSSARASGLSNPLLMRALM
jgi:hypothetical protein